jgi:hypothetical protein
LRIVESYTREALIEAMGATLSLVGAQDTSIHFKSTRHRELRFHTLLTASCQEPRLEWTVVDS